MKLKEVIVGPSSAISRKDMAIFSISEIEAKNLTDALNVIDYYKNAAFKVLDKKKDDADWRETEFCVKNGCVEITVNDCHHRAPDGGH